MPLGTREVLVAIRARDVTSRILREIGNNFTDLGGKSNAAAQKMFNTSAALTAVGVGLAGIGAAGVKFFDDSIDSFIDYNKQAALTKTQVDQVGVSVSDLEKIGKRTASRIPIPFDNMQDALFDIFSSIDVNVSEAEFLLNKFSKAAVAGQTDVRTAARSTIGMMNAYKIPISEVDRVLDVQFETVRKGVVTYEELNTSIGQAIPAARAAGQSIETLGGMMAFLTRNDLSAARASTSAARAIELIAEPKSVANLEKLGVSVKDSSGEFRQLDDIIQQLAVNQGWADLTGPERRKAFKDVFGTARIQARRFFDTAIPNWKEFNSLTETVRTSSGAMGDAYDVMFDTPAAKAQILANKWELLKVTIGEELLPAKERLIDAATRILEKWESLDSSTKNLIIQVAAGAAVFSTVAGVVLTVVGVFGMLVAMIAPLVGGIAVAIGFISGIAVAIAAAVAAAIIVFNIFEGGVKGIIAAVAAAVGAFAGVAGAWTAVAAVIGGAAIPIVGWIALIIAAVIALALIVVKNWGTINGWIQAVWQSMQSFWDWLSRNAVGVWHSIHSVLVSFWGLVQDLASFLWQGFQGVWDNITGPAVSAWHAVQDALDTFWGWVKDFASWFMDNFGPGFVRIWESLREGVGGVIEELIETFESLWSNFSSGISSAYDFLRPFIEFFTGVFLDTITFVWNMLVSTVTMQLRIVGTIISAAAEIIMGIWRPLWNIFFATAKFAFDLVSNNIKIVLNTVQAIIETFIGIIVAAWNNFGSVIFNIVKAAWDALATIIASVITIISNAIQFFLNLIQGDWGEAWQNIKNIFVAAWDAIWAALQLVWQLIKSFFIELPGAILGFIGDVVRLLWNKGSDILSGLWNGLKNVWNSLKEWVSDLPGNIKDILGTVTRTLFQKGKEILDGLWDGIKDKWRAAADWFRGLKDRVVNIIKDIFNISSPSRVMIPLGEQIIAGVVKGLVTSSGALTETVKSLGLNTMDAMGIVFGGVADFFTGLIPGGGQSLSDQVTSMLQGNSGMNQLIGQQMAAAIGWTGSHWSALNALVMSESGWNNMAQNPVSTAFGIGQFLNSTWSTVGATKTTDPVAQIAAMLRYIQGRYGNPKQAWSFKRAFNWYEKGAWNLLNDQLALLHKGEMVVPSSTADMIRRLPSDFGQSQSQSGGGNKIGVYVENLYVRDTNIVDDLDWFDRTHNTGV